ncbi:MAG: lamin tail domain-containing protein [Flavobacteriales bacterium]
MKYFLSIFFIFSIATFSYSQDCSDLFFSEYVEGPNNDNGLEIFNPTTETISLTGYSINRYSNGSLSVTDRFDLTGEITPGQAIAIGNGQLDSIYLEPQGYWSQAVSTEFYDACQMHGTGIYPSPFYFNGDDAITLEKDNEKVDIFGKIGQDPGAGWTDNSDAGFTDANGGDWLSKRQTLIRKSTILKGVTSSPIVFDVMSQWDTLPDATYTELGAHVCDCETSSASISESEVSFVMYPNPSLTGTSVSISTSSKINSVVIFDALGREVKNLVSVSNKNALISLKNIEAGNYLVSILFDNGSQKNTSLVVK